MNAVITNNIGVIPLSCKKCSQYSSCMERDRDYRCREFKRRKNKKSSGGNCREDSDKTRSI